MTLAELRQYLTNANVRAFARVLREGESLQTHDAYRIRYNGAGPRAFFDDFSKHPRVLVPIPNDPQGRYSTAAGAFQFTYTTWSQEVEPQLKLLFGRPVDFSPAMQEAGLVVLLSRTGQGAALRMVVEGKLDEAIALCRGRWTSLPGAAENKRVTFEVAHAVYEKYGGTYGPAVATAPKPPAPAAPIEDKSTTYESEGEDMGALGAGLIGELLQTVVGAFAPAARQRVEQAAEKVTDPAGAKVLADGLMGVLQQITGTKDPIQATAAVTAPTPEGKAALAKAETAFVVKLDELAPYLVQIAELEAKGWKQTEESREAARTFTTPEAWKLRWAQVTFAQKALAYASIISAVLIAVMTIALIWIPPDARSAVLNLLGQLVIVLVTTIGLLGATLRDQNGFSFGGTVDSNAAAIGRSEIEARRQKPTKETP